MIEKIKPIQILNNPPKNNNSNSLEYKKQNSKKEIHNFSEIFKQELNLLK